LSFSLLTLLLAQMLSGFAAESVTIAFGGKNARCEVIKFLKGKNDELQVQAKFDFGEQTLPLRVFSAGDVHKCYDALSAKSPQLRLDMGNYFFSKEQFDDATIELNAAMKGDPALKPQAEALLQKIESNKAITKVASETRKTDPTKLEKSAPPPEPEKPEKPKGETLVIKLDPDGKRTIVRMGKGDYSDEMSAEDFAKRWCAARFRRSRRKR